MLPLTDLTFQLRRFFVLPWTMQPNGSVVFHDEGWLGRWSQLVFSHLSFLTAGTAVGLALITFVYVPHLRSLTTGLLLLGVPFAVVGARLRPLRPCRTVLVTPGGQVRITGSRPSIGHRQVPIPAGSVAFVTLDAQVEGVTWRAFALVIADGGSCVAICMHRSQQACFDTHAALPDCVRRLPVHQHDQIVSAFEKRA